MPGEADAICVDAASPAGADWGGGSFGPVTCGTKTDDAATAFDALLAGLDTGADGLIAAAGVGSGPDGACATESCGAEE